MRRRKLFTMLELIVACAIAAVMTALAGSIVYTFPGSCADMREAAERLEGLNAMEAFADTVVRNALPVYWRDEDGRERQIFRGDRDCMILAGTADGGQDGHLLFCAMGLRDGRIVIQYRETPILYWLRKPGEIGAETLREETVLTGVKSLEICYGRRENGEVVWLEDWDEERYGGSAVLPPVIAWTVTFEDDSRVHFIRRTRGNSYYTGWGRYDEAS